MRSMSRCTHAAASRFAHWRHVVSAPRSQPLTEQGDAQAHRPGAPRHAFLSEKYLKECS
jgi:hypothetical protein